MLPLDSFGWRLVAMLLVAMIRSYALGGEAMCILRDDGVSCKNQLCGRDISGKPAAGIGIPGFTRPSPKASTTLPSIAVLCRYGWATGE